ncbi:hypothetical protein Ahy_B10g102317 [Arachis hypogaea]|uniref:Uncharacterized protein n=1 Tax=Arachis hypogaea TaxID=3818 RepID=A0A444X1H3_ARAHY|nr:hypothetical protein Ahy_B10g102317 [Arachis hypogaea]
MHCEGRIRSLRQIKRACCCSSLNFFYLFLIVVILRGTISARYFGTPEQDLNEIHHLYAYRSRRVEPHRVLEEAQPETTTNDTNNYATFDISKILVDEAAYANKPKREPNAPYTLGSKIFDWDKQRGQLYGIEISYNMALLDAEMEKKSNHTYLLGMVDNGAVMAAVAWYPD